MDESNKTDGLLRQLDFQRQTFADTIQQLQQVLAQGLANTDSVSLKDLPKSPTATTAEPRSPRSPRPSIVSRTTLEKESRGRKSSAGLATLQTSSASRATGEDSDSDDGDDDDYYAKEVLPSQQYDHDGLRQHLRSYKWTEHDKRILHNIVSSPARMSQPTLFPTTSGPAEDRSHLSYYQVFDVGPDGAPLPVELQQHESPSNALAIWNSIKDVNKADKERRAVGRISIFHEPSPILFGAIHHVLHQHFDVDGLFRHLVDPAYSSADMHRAYDSDQRKQRTFVFNFEYFTILGENCQPMDWQMADRQNDRKKHHIAITRCSSVVALALGGAPIKKWRNRSRRKTTDYGYAYDPFAPWQLANIQCYPDWRASTDIHESSKNYVNGVEAFMVTLLGEFRDAISRFEEIYNRVTDLVTPPLGFMFDPKIRDTLLFEDAEFTYSRRYFWADQTLGIINESIKRIVDAFEDTFTDDVWEGKHKSLWPLLDQESPKNVYFKKRMAGLRTKFEREVKKLRGHISENNERRKEIKDLREDLYVGTSIQESRKSVENTEIAIQQGHNIKILTLVSIFFLPLTFVTSVFGMTNMPTERHYWAFGIVTATVCVPFFILIGSLNTTRGMQFWREEFFAIFHHIGKSFSRVFRRRRVDPGEDSASNPSRDANSGRITPREDSMGDGRVTRLRRWSSAQHADQSRDSVDLKSIELRAAPTARPFFGRAKSSRIAEMWNAESLRKTTSV